MPRPVRTCANSPAKDKVACPVCGQLCSSTTINIHLDKCLSGEMPSQGRKRSRPDSESEGELEIDEAEPTVPPPPAKSKAAKSSPVKPSPVKSSPIKPTPVKPTPIKPTPVKLSPAKLELTKPAKTKSASSKSSGKLNAEWLAIMKGQPGQPKGKKEKDSSKPPKKKVKKSSKKDTSSSGSTDETGASKKTKGEKGEKKKKRKKKRKEKGKDDVFSFDAEEDHNKTKVKASSKDSSPKPFSPSKAQTFGEKHSSQKSPSRSFVSQKSPAITPISGVSPVSKGANWTFGSRPNLPTASPNAQLVKPNVQPPKSGSQTPLAGKPQSPQTGKANVPPSTQPRPDFRPLAEKMRPYTMDTLIGQTKAIGATCTLRRLLDTGNIPSMIFWGPPGCGKTSLANVIARQAKVRNTHRFITLSATTSNVSDVRSAVEIARNEQRLSRRKTILFIDEIHRFNKTQQDAFLLHVENGTIILIGATTENPSFRVNSALLSRCRVVVLEKLSPSCIMQILERALKDSQVSIAEDPLAGPVGAQANKSQSNSVSIERQALYLLANLCDGDARSALNSLEMVLDVAKGSSTSGQGQQGTTSSELGQRSHVITSDEIKDCLQKSHISYDKTGEEHYNCTSALQKSIRASDANASLYWLGRMLVGGEDPMYIARRLVVIASEDIGLADSQALVQAMTTYQACNTIGLPECELNLAHCVIYLSRAPKSRQVCTALARVKECIQTHQGPTPPVPLHLQMPATKYQLVHNTLGGWGKGRQIAGGYQGFLPESLAGLDFFS